MKTWVMGLVLLGVALAQRVPVTTIGMLPVVDLPPGSYRTLDGCDDLIADVLSRAELGECYLTVTDSPSLFVQRVKLDLEIAGYDFVGETVTDSGALAQGYFGPGGAQYALVFVFREEGVLLIAARGNFGP